MLDGPVFEKEPLRVFKISTVHLRFLKLGVVSTLLPGKWTGTTLLLPLGNACKGCWIATVLLREYKNHSEIPKRLLDSLCAILKGYWEPTGKF